MILKTKTPKIESFGELAESQFGVSKEDQVHVLSILRDKLYSDKILAVIREYSTNAVDAHVEAGIPETPIKVSIPTRFNPQFVVRDYGAGLTDDEVLNLYTKYGASTKRDTNDAIGQLGVGCKSAFSYSDSFAVTSYVNGKASLFNAYIDESGLGKMTKLNEIDTDEPDGIEITVPVKEYDFSYFSNKASTLFQFFDVMPDTNIDVPAVEYSMQGDFWGLKKPNANNRHARNGNVVMGNIGYRVDPSKIKNLTNSEKTLFSSAHLDIKVPIGFVSISASRESLEYTENTQANLKRAIAKVLGEISEKINETFKSCKTEWEARLKYLEYSQTLRRSLGYNSPQLALLKQFAKWNDTDLTATSINAYDTENLTIKKVSPGSNVVTRNTYYNQTVNIDKNLLFIINDTKSSWVKKVVALRDHVGGNHSIILKNKSYFDDNDLKVTPTDKEFEKNVLDYIKKNGIEGIKIYRLSNLPKGVELPKAEKMASKKVYGKVFKLTDVNFVNRRKSDAWEKIDVDLKNDAGVYLVIDRFLPKDMTRESFRDMFNALKTIGVDASLLKIIGIKKDQVDKVGNKWVKFETFFSQKISDWAVKENIIQKVADMEEYNNSHRLPIKSVKYILGKKHLFENKDSLFLEFCEKYIEFEKKITKSSVDDRVRLNIARRWADSITAAQKVPPTYQLKKKYSEVKTRYPLIALTSIFNQYQYNDNGSWVEPVIDYCNKIEE